MLPVLFLMGPTASGKTNLAIQLVKELNCEIISVDSAMIYKGMDIGTAKPTQSELDIAPHHLIDIIQPTQDWSVSDFCRLTTSLISEIHQRQKIPLLTGGTMMYFKTFLDGLSESLPAASETLRFKLMTELREQGIEHLAQQLIALDPASQNRIDLKNPQRVIRALEVFQTSGRSITAYWDEQKEVSHPWPIIQFGLSTDDRNDLHQRIAQRFDIMLESGFEQEVESIIKLPGIHPDMTSMRSVGYRQMWQYLAGELSFDDMREKGIAATRQLAKRQLTWLRKWEHLNRVNYSDRQLFDLITNKIKLSISGC